MKAIKYFMILVVASMAFAACESNLYDWDVMPATEIAQIPQEGGIYHFMGFDRE